MTYRPLVTALTASAGLLVAACGGDTEDGLAVRAQPMIDHHADLAAALYADVAVQGHALDAAIDAFVAAPSPTTLAAARAAWIAARAPYRQTEALRFYGGPIDDPDDEREPRINAWPMDEAYVDYVDGNPSAGVINDATGFPTLDAATLTSINFVGGESNVAVGFHAIEFLLWGQDQSTAGPGARPHTDFVDGGTAANQARRRGYLTTVSDLLVADLDHVAARWSASGDYRATFTGAPVESLTRILTGLGTLSASELSGERMLTAYENKDQEDEHSCFSDTTLDDLTGNLAGIEAVWFGRGAGPGPGPALHELVTARDPELATRMADQLAAATRAMAAIPGPFDQAILGADADAGRTQVLAAIRAVQAIGDTVVEVAEALDVPVSTEL